jgi:carbon-monoxide dehydrogenase medium subunit
MIPPAFRYHRPKTVPAALRLLQEHGEVAKILSGGQSLLPLMKMRISAPEHLVDVSRIPALGRIRFKDGMLRVGATATHRMIEASSVVRRYAPLLAETASTIGDLQIRNLGTIGGSIAHADPAADYPAAALALSAEVMLAAPGGERAVPAAEFFQGIMATAMRAGELLVEVRVPAAPVPTGSAYVKMPNPASGFALAGVAAVVGLDEVGRCTHVSIGVTGVAAAAFTPRAAEAVLAGQAPTDDLIDRAAALVPEGVDAIEDLHATAAYRLRLARVLTRRAVALARDRAQGAGRRRTGAAAR